MSLSRFRYLGLFFFGLLFGGLIGHWADPVNPGRSEGTADPNAACASCHREIYERYRTTPMANASGPAADGFIAADFRHARSGVHYRIEQESGRVWLIFDRDEKSRSLSGRRELLYYIGSGKRGRTYLFEQQGYWFESPINWYARKQVWDMAPNFLSAWEMPLTLPVDPGCLHCHASGVGSTLPGARNHFVGEPFAKGGITCVACHGDAASHLASNGKAPMLKIGSLEPLRRDSICLNCHLEGQAAVDREGKRSEQFAPGDDLFDYAAFFVYKDETGSGGRATSQWEALIKSACWRKSEGRLTCTTCHDPHGSPPPERRVSFYRERCLQCHAASRFAEKHHPENQDCVSCHMAKPPSSDIAHEQITDHWIRKRVNQDRLPLTVAGTLQTVGGIQASDRDFGLAYAQMAERGDAQAATRAVELLLKAEKDNGGATEDSQLHEQLGFLEQESGQTNDAAAEYRKALHADAHDALSEGNLALIEAKRHHAEDAIRLERDVFENDPSQLTAGINLAILECVEGDKGAVLATLNQILVFSPDSERARSFAEKIRSGSVLCGDKSRSETPPAPSR